jgi:hypothetical protein
MFTSQAVSERIAQMTLVLVASCLDKGISGMVWVYKRILSHAPGIHVNAKIVLADPKTAESRRIRPAYSSLLYF